VKRPIALGACLTLLVLALLGRDALGAPQAAKALYARATTLEKTLREAGGRATLADYRAVISAYDTVVRKFPTSGYVDNALWQGAGVAREAFGRFGEEHDQATARRFLELLANQYPASPFVPKAWSALKSLDAPPRPSASARPAAPVKPPAREAAPPAPRDAQESVVLRDVRRTVLPESVRITLELDGRTQYRTERVEGPPRVLFDLSNARLGEGVPEGTLSYEGDVARRLRIGRHPNQIVRVVLDLTGVTQYHVTTMEQPFRIVIDCQRAAAAASAPVERATSPGSPVPTPPPAASLPAFPAIVGPMPAAAAADAAQGPQRPLESRRLRTAWSLSPPCAAPVSPFVETRPLFAFSFPGPSWRVSPPTATPTPPELPAFTPNVVSESVPIVPPTRPVPRTSSPAAGQASGPATVGPRGPFTLARQLGLGATRVIIDPGHGGHDPGALGQRISEAEVVLDVALKLEALLKEAGIGVVLTRRTDEFVPLEERPAIAMREQGDLFLSIHANASRKRTVRGIESYVLNFATDPDAEEVAARENASTGRTLGSLPEIVKAITLNSKLNESRSFAGLIQRAMTAELKVADPGLRDLGVKQAPFVVLIGASMPSVLVEISFITNPQEGRLLKTSAYRERIATALFSAIRGYQTTLKSVQALPRR
jgi:N-acetylmuramoyl-L-alanine amidase